MKLKVYLGGPITGLDPQRCREAFARKAAELIAYSEGTFADAWDVFNPWHNYDLQKKEMLDKGIFKEEPRYEDIMAADLKTLSGCDGAYFMEGWEQSTGCQMEINKCRELGIPMCMNGDDGQVVQFEKSMILRENRRTPPQNTTAEHHEV